MDRSHGRLGLIVAGTDIPRRPAAAGGEQYERYKCDEEDGVSKRGAERNCRVGRQADRDRGQREVAQFQRASNLHCSDEGEDEYGEQQDDYGAGRVFGEPARSRVYERAPPSLERSSERCIAGCEPRAERDPRVRLKLRDGLRYRWHTGTAHLLSDDDPRERQRWLASQLPSSAGNARAVRLFGTQLVTVRIDLVD